MSPDVLQLWEFGSVLCLHAGLLLGLQTTGLHVRYDFTPKSRPPPPPPPSTPHTRLFLPREAAAGVERCRAGGHAAVVTGISGWRGRKERCGAARVRVRLSRPRVTRRGTAEMRGCRGAGGVGGGGLVCASGVFVWDQVCSGFLPDHSGATMTSRGVSWRRTHNTLWCHNPNVVFYLSALKRKTPLKEHAVFGHITRWVLLSRTLLRPTWDAVPHRGVLSVLRLVRSRSFPPGFPFRTSRLWFER